MRFTLLTLLFTILLASCGKYNYKRDCCTGSINISTSNYNTDSVYVLAPNAFTPNGDGINDVFRLNYLGLTGELYSLRIYVRNKTYFETDKLYNSWDGTTSDGVRAKPKQYSYEFSGKTIHGDLIEGSGKFCLIKQAYTNKIKSCSSCYFGDQFDITTGEYSLETYENIGCSE